MKQITSNPDLVAYCGLYCGACGAYLRERCPGCHENHKATWCKVRSCCADNQFSSCAACREYANASDCRKFNNLVAKLFGFIFRSDRAACIRQIREIGIPAHAEDMARNRRQTLRKS